MGWAHPRSAITLSPARAFPVPRIMVWRNRLGAASCRWAVPAVRPLRVAWSLRIAFGAVEVALLAWKSSFAFCRTSSTSRQRKLAVCANVRPWRVHSLGR